MKVSTKLFRDDVEELAEDANIDKKGLLIQFLYLRSIGESKTNIESLIDVSRRTLLNWEDKIEDSLNVCERSELAAKATLVEHDKRFSLSKGGGE